MKRILAIMIAAAMVLGLASCSGAVDSGKDNTTDIIGPAADSCVPELTIVMSGRHKEYASSFLGRYIKTFEDKYGVKIKFDVIEISENITFTIGNATYSFVDDKAVQSFKDKLAMKMYVEDGPELLFYMGEDFSSFISQGAIMNVKGKIPNLDKVYDSLLGDKVYYTPIGMLYTPRILNKEIMKEIGAEAPGTNWTKSDYDAIIDKWQQKVRLPFTKSIYYSLVNDKLNSICEEAVKNKGMSLDKDAVKEFITSTRNKIFSGRYEIDPKYKYENYYNMLFELQSDESKKNLQIEDSEEYGSKMIGSAPLYCNPLRADTVTEALKKDVAFILPAFSDQKEYISSFGFLVNKNGKNVDLAYEFLSALLSDEMQMMLYNDKYSWYPVNKDIEGKIDEIEKNLKVDDRAIYLKQHILRNLYTGKGELAVASDSNMSEIRPLLDKDFVKLIFADTPLEGDKLSKELQSLEGKYNIWLNE